MDREREAVALLVVMVIAAGVIGCGGNGDAAGTARVSVQQVMRPEQLLGVEGSVSFVVIEHAGTTVRRRHAEHLNVRTPLTLVDEPIEPGAYTVRSYRRLCPPSTCREDPFDPTSPTVPLRDLEGRVAECAAPLEIADGEMANVRVTINPTDGRCSIDVG